MPKTSFVLPFDRPAGVDAVIIIDNEGVECIGTGAAHRICQFEMPPFQMIPTLQQSYF